MSTAKENTCRKFQANFFNKSKCQNCFKPRELHLLTDQDLTQVSQNPTLNLKYNLVFYILVQCYFIHFKEVLGGLQSKILEEKKASKSIFSLALRIPLKPNL